MLSLLGNKLLSCMLLLLCPQNGTFQIFAVFKGISGSISRKILGCSASRSLECSRTVHTEIQLRMLNCRRFSSTFASLGHSCVGMFVGLVVCFAIYMVCQKKSKNCSLMIEIMFVPPLQRLQLMPSFCADLDTTLQQAGWVCNQETSSFWEVGTDLGQIFSRLKF